MTDNQSVEQLIPPKHNVYIGQELIPIRWNLVRGEFPGPEGKGDPKVEQIRGGFPPHVQAAWAVPIFTHCPSDLVPLQASCNSCRTDAPVE
jgi:hypothetical protein